MAHLRFTLDVSSGDVTSPLIIFMVEMCGLSFDLYIRDFRSQSTHGLAGASSWMVAVDLDEDNGPTWTVVLMDAMVSGGHVKVP